MIGDDISVSVIEIRGDQVRIGVDAPKTVKVYRREVYEAILAENKAAAQSKPVLPDVDFVSLGAAGGKQQNSAQLMQG